MALLLPVLSRCHACMLTECTEKSSIVGKAGRIVLIDNEIRVLCGEVDVFRCDMNNCEYFIHMSGDGITVKGPNTVTGEDDHIMIFYKYYRK